MKLVLNKDKAIIAKIEELMKKNNNQCPEGLRKGISRNCICENCLMMPVGTFCDCGKYYKEEE